MAFSFVFKLGPEFWFTVSSEGNDSLITRLNGTQVYIRPADLAPTETGVCILSARQNRSGDIECMYYTKSNGTVIPICIEARTKGVDRGFYVVSNGFQTIPLSQLKRENVSWKCEKDLTTKKGTEALFGPSAVDLCEATTIMNSDGKRILCIKNGGKILTTSPIIGAHISANGKKKCIVTENSVYKCQTVAKKNA